MCSCCVGKERGSPPRKATHAPRFSDRCRIGAGQGDESDTALTKEMSNYRPKYSILPDNCQGDTLQKIERNAPTVQKAANTMAGSVLVGKCLCQGPLKPAPTPPSLGCRWAVRGDRISTRTLNSIILNLCQDPFLRAPRACISEEILGGCVNSVRSGLAARQTLKQVQGDEFGKNRDNASAPPAGERPHGFQ